MLLHEHEHQKHGYYQKFTMLQHKLNYFTLKNIDFTGYENVHRFHMNIVTVEKIIISIKNRFYINYLVFIFNDAFIFQGRL